MKYYKKFVVSLSLVIILALGLDIVIKNHGFLLIDNAIAQSTDPVEVGEGYCHIYVSCPSDATYGGVGCYGYDYCSSIFNIGVDCDGIVSWCY